MGKQQALLKPPIKTKSTNHRRQSLQELPFISSQSLKRLQHALQRTQTSLEQQHKAQFHASMTYQKQKQHYLALKYANECTQLRKLAQTIQSQQYRISQLQQDLQSATTEAERVKLRTCTSLIIQTLQDYVTNTPPAIKLHMAPLVEMLDYNLRPYY
jgi:division protein CdvB (Snf7/Vps24/ESCRT-III family)